MLELGKVGDGTEALARYPGSTARVALVHRKALQLYTSLGLYPFITYPLLRQSTGVATVLHSLMTHFLSWSNILTATLTRIPEPHLGSRCYCIMHHVRSRTALFMHIQNHNSSPETMLTLIVTQ